MVSRIACGAVVLAALTYGLALTAQESSPPKAGDAAQIKESLSLKEQILIRQYQEFEQQLLRLKQRLERSPKQDDRDRAVVLERVLEYCKDKSISVKFEQMVDVLKSKELKSLPDIENALDRSSGIAEELRTVIAMLREDSKSKIIQDEMKRLDQIRKDLERVIQDQKSAQAMTERGKTGSKELKKIQEDVSKKTVDIAQRLAGKEGGEAKNTKGDPKTAGKNGDKAAEAKGDGEKSSQAKDGGDGKEPKGSAKGGDPKEGKEGGDSQAKGGEGKEGAGKEGTKDGKNPEGAQAKDGGKSGESPKGEPKSGGEKPGDPAQAKSGESKPGEPKSGSPSEAKSGKGSEAKPGQAKESKSGAGEPSQAKSGEGKPSEGGAKSKPGQAKAGDKSDGQSQAKDSGAKSGSSPPPGPQASNKDGGKKNGPPQQAKDSPPNGKKQVEEAYDKQQQATEKIEQNKNDEASNKQEKAVEDLEKAKKELEKLLRQLREEELERILANLQLRCEKMLAMQRQVLAGTEAVDKVVKSNPNKAPNRDNKQESIRLSDTEGEIVLEASKAIEILEAEGSAVAFPEVFQQVREDMKHVQRRLGIADVAELTQGIEKDIITSLEEMVDALKKKQKEMADAKSNPPPPGSPPPGADQKLLEKIAELKMIRSLQVRVNGRTQTYGKMYQGEQALEPTIRRELHDLSERQERIFEITNRMAKGDNQ